MLPVVVHVRTGDDGRVLLELGVGLVPLRQADGASGSSTLSLRRLQMQFSNIQHGVGLKSSSTGKWSQDAGTALAAWLLRPPSKQNAGAARCGQGPWRRGHVCCSWFT